MFSGQKVIYNKILAPIYHSDDPLSPGGPHSRRVGPSQARSPHKWGGPEGVRGTRPPVEECVSIIIVRKI